MEQQQKVGKVLLSLHRQGLLMPVIQAMLNNASTPGFITARHMCLAPNSTFQASSAVRVACLSTLCLPAAEQCHCLLTVFHTCLGKLHMKRIIQG